MGWFRCQVGNDKYFTWLWTFKSPCSTEAELIHPRLIHVVHAPTDRKSYSGETILWVWPIVSNDAASIRSVSRLGYGRPAVRFAYWLFSAEQHAQPTQFIREFGRQWTLLITVLLMGSNSLNATEILLAGRGVIIALSAAFSTSLYETDEQ
jgi:hypothetical protein